MTQQPVRPTKRATTFGLTAIAFALAGNLGCGASDEFVASGESADASVLPGEGNGPNTNADGSTDAGPTDGSADSRPSGPSQCVSDNDCIALDTTPPRCAIPRCNAGFCSYVAVDLDHDTHPTADCLSLILGTSVIVGDDCDDDDSALYPGHPRDCSTLPDGGVVTFPGGAARGECRAGKQSCDGARVGACLGTVGPRREDCSTADKDEDCDGSPSNGCPCSPINSTKPCGQHPGKDGVGICRAGTETCTASGWSSCTGYVDPKIRDCASTADNDCDGRADNTVDAACKCVPGSTSACDTHPGKDGLGICRAGSQSCFAASGTSAFGSCSGSVPPRTRDCASTTDYDCDGRADSTIDAVCKCAPGSRTACETHPGKDGIGICRAGSQTCVAGTGTSAYGACSGSVAPRARDCSSTTDNDCDGRPDNSTDSVCRCSAGSVAACDTHPGKDGIGVCRAGSQTCVAANGTTSYGGCTGSVAPRGDDCEAVGGDYDCNGIRGDGAGCTKLMRVYIHDPGGESCFTDSIFVQDAENPSQMPSNEDGPIPFREFTTFRLFRSPGPNKVEVRRCDSGPLTHQVHIGSACTFLGYASTVHGGNGWAELGIISTNLSSDVPQSTGFVTLPPAASCCGCVSNSGGGPPVYTLR